METHVFDEVYKDTELAQLFGKETKCLLNDDDAAETSGYWTKGDVNSHLPGHHLHEDYADSSVTLTRIHDDGSLILAKDQALDKYAALRNELPSKKSEESMPALLKSKGAAEKMWQLHAMIQGALQPPRDEDKGRKKDGAVVNGDMVCSSDDESGESRDRAVVPASLFARLRPGVVKAPPSSGGSSSAARTHQGANQGGSKAAFVDQFQSLATAATAAVPTTGYPLLVSCHEP